MIWFRRIDVLQLKVIDVGLWLGEHICLIQVQDPYRE